MVNGNPHTLSATDVLLALLSNGDSSITTLARSLNREVSHINRVVSELEQQSLVQRYIGRDARISLIRLTEQGSNQAMLSQLKNYLLLNVLEEQNEELNKYLSDVFIEFKRRFRK